MKSVIEGHLLFPRNKIIISSFSVQDLDSPGWTPSSFFYVWNHHEKLFRIQIRSPLDVNVLAVLVLVLRRPIKIFKLSSSDVLVPVLVLVPAVLVRGSSFRLVHLYLFINDGILELKRSKNQRHWNRLSC